MTPLRIDITLVGPIGRPARPIHLDSLIAHQIVQRDLPPNADIPAIRQKIEELPLERRDVGGDWVWAASSVAFEWRTPPSQNFATRSVRAPTIAEWQMQGIFTNRREESAIDTSRGTFKAAVYAHELQWAPRAVAYCIGDKDEITDLLANLESIGARRRLGGGQIANLEVVEDPVAKDLWPHRYLPMDAAAGIPVEGAYRLPLFDRSHQTIVRDNSLTFDQLELA